ncbi:MAG: hypothetical protein AB1483_12630 [Candidatus Zixiibacteriota bacterium]
MRASKKAAVLLISAVMVLASFSLVSAQSVVVDHVDGLNAGGGIDDGAVLTFYMRLTGDATPHYVISNGFRVYGDGLEWGGMTGTLNPAYKWDLSFGFPCFFDLGMFINYFADGVGADTIGFGGAAGMYGTGLPAGFDDIGYWFTIGPVHGPQGAVLTVDSSFYRPAGRWVWDIVEANVAWGGPYTYMLGEEPVCPEVITYLEQDPIILKDLADRVLRVYVECEDNAGVDLSSVVVQGKIPPYTAARIEGDLLVTDVFIFRFLSAWRPISADVQGTYSVGYSVNGEFKTLYGDMNLQVYAGDLNFDGIEDVNDITFLVDYMFKGGKAPMLEEALDVNRDGYNDIRDLRAIVEIVY